MFRKIRTVAFPPEHGSWGLTFEPLTLALIVAFSNYGIILFLGATFAFLTHQPVRVLLTGRADRKLAFYFLILYGIPAIIFLTMFLNSTPMVISLPLIFSLILMVIYLIAEIFKLHRALLTEIMASIAMGLIALSIVLAGGWRWPQAWPFLILLYLRSLNTTLYVHFRLKLERAQLSSFFWAQTWQWLTLALASFLLINHLIPFLASVSIFVLSFRGIMGLSPWRKPQTVKQIGMLEFFYGLQFVVLSTIGYFIS